jgi:hypothetical protein
MHQHIYFQDFLFSQAKHYNFYKYFGKPTKKYTAKLNTKFVSASSSCSIAKCDMMMDARVKTTAVPDEANTNLLTQVQLKA